MVLPVGLTETVESLPWWTIMLRENIEEPGVIAQEVGVVASMPGAGHRGDWRTSGWRCQELRGRCWMSG